MNAAPRTLVVRPDSVGDVLLAGPAVRAAAAGHRVDVTGGPDARRLTAAVARDRARDLGGRTGLHQLAGVLAGARAAVVGNTGPAPLAAAAGTPVVSLFAPVVPAERRPPYGVPHVLRGDQQAPCADSRARSCPVPGHPCLDGVSDAELLGALAGVTTGRDAAVPAATGRADGRAPGAGAPRTPTDDERGATV
ncbi:glycosyltransferase family 9 protein [Streptomyces platensis]